MTRLSGAVFLLVSFFFDVLVFVLSFVFFIALRQCAIDHVELADAVSCERGRVSTFADVAPPPRCAFRSASSSSKSKTTTRRSIGFVWFWSNGVSERNRFGSMDSGRRAARERSAASGAKVFKVYARYSTRRSPTDAADAQLVGQARRCTVDRRSPSCLCGGTRWPSLAKLTGLTVRVRGWGRMALAIA